MKRGLIPWSILSSLTAGLTSTAFAVTYVVKSGDTLSEISRRELGGPVYGQRGTLARVLAHNPQIRDPHLIRTGDEIELPIEQPNEVELTQTTVPSRTPATTESELTSPPERPEDPREAQGFVRYSLLEARPLFYYSRIDGHDTQNSTDAVLLSKLNYGLDLSWTQVLGTRLRSFQVLGLRKEEYIPDTSGTAEIRNSKQVLTHLGGGLRYYWTERFFAGAGLFLSQELFYRGLSGTGNAGISLEAVTLPRADFELGAKLFDIAPFTVDTVWGGKLYFPVDTGKYETRLSAAYRGKIEISQQFQAVHLNCGFFYRAQTLKSSILDLSRRDAGLEIGLTWRPGSP